MYKKKKKKKPSVSKLIKVSIKNFNDKSTRMKFSAQ